MVTIDETARVDPLARLGEGVRVGPYCVVGPEATIGRGSELLCHVHVMGDVTLGEFNRLGACVIGGDPQDVSHKGTPTRVEIGDHNVIREGVTIHRASEKEDRVTRIGSHNALMSGSHVAHDCQLADRISLGQGVLLGGHVRVESDAFLEMGAVAVHNVTIGEFCLVGAKSKINQDVPRFMMVEGNPAHVRRINLPGLKRSGIDRAGLLALHEAYRLIYRARMNLKLVAETLAAQGRFTPEVARLLEFLHAQQDGKNGRSREPRKGR